MSGIDPRLYVLSERQAAEVAALTPNSAEYLRDSDYPEFIRVSDALAELTTQDSGPDFLMTLDRYLKRGRGQLRDPDHIPISTIAVQRFRERIDQTLDVSVAGAVLFRLYHASRWIPPNRWYKPIEYPTGGALRYAVYKRGKFHRGVLFVIAERHLIDVFSAMQYGARFGWCTAEPLTEALLIRNRCK